MTLPASYSTEYAGPARASRVAVAPRIYRYAERLVPADRRAIPPSPQAVLMAAGELAWGIAYADRLLVVDHVGTHEYPAGRGQWIAALDPDGVRLGNRIWAPGADAPAELGPMGIFDDGCVQTVASWRDGVWITVAQRRATFAPNQVMVRVRGNGPRYHDATAPRWALDWPGEGTAAVADDGTVVLAGIDRSLHVLEHPRDPTEREPIVRAQFELPHEPYAISAIDGGFVVLSAIEAAPPDPAIRLGRLHGRGLHRFAASWRTEVRAFDRDLQTTWSAELGFAALQPAIDGGSGRVVIAGRGLAGLEQGIVRWSLATAHEALATAFVDGSLAVGVGAHLVIVDPDGRTAQTVAVPEGHTVVTPPAIGPDGSLAFGTDAHTYVVPGLDA